MSRTKRNLTLRQTTTFPFSNATTLNIEPSSSSSSDNTFDLRIRIPSWASSPPIITLNGKPLSTTPVPGTYLSIKRTWSPGDTVTIQLPMNLRLIRANDKSESVAAVAYGPTILAGNYGDATLRAVPTLDLGSLKREEGGKGLGFVGRADGKEVRLGPFFDAHGFNYNVYWGLKGALPVGF